MIQQSLPIIDKINSLLEKRLSDVEKWLKEDHEIDQRDLVACMRRLGSLVKIIDSTNIALIDCILRTHDNQQQNLMIRAQKIQRIMGIIEEIKPRLPDVLQEPGNRMCEGRENHLNDLEQRRENFMQRLVIKQNAFQNALDKSPALRSDWEKLQEGLDNVGECTELKSDIHRSCFHVGEHEMDRLLASSSEEVKVEQMRRLKNLILDYTRGDVELTAKSLVLTNQSLGANDNELLNRKYLPKNIMPASTRNWGFKRYWITKNQKNGHLEISMANYWKLLNFVERRSGYIKTRVIIDLHDNTTTIKWTETIDFEPDENFEKEETQEMRDEVMQKLDILENEDAIFRSVQTDD